MVYWLDLLCISYFAALNAVHALLMGLSAIELGRAKALHLPELDNLNLSAESTPPVAVIVPAFNEEAVIIDAVRGMLHIDYPDFQVIVVNDGSQDRTIEVLRERFQLYPVSHAYRDELKTETILAIYRSPVEPRILVVDKKNGGKADALNAGIKVARAPLVCCLDADSIIDRKAILRLAEPFLYSPQSVVASGGTIRIANGMKIEDGIVVESGLSKSWLARIQTVEYLRAFLFARLGLNLFGGNLIISGAMGLFSREILMELGGYDHTVGEDMELVVRMHRHLKAQKRDYKITFIPDPVCYTEAPEKLTALGQQRDRWQRGLLDSLRRHKRMFLNPKYGAIGLFSFPYYLLFELFGPIVELCGYIWFAYLAFTGRINEHVSALFIIAAFLMGYLVTIQALVLDELAFRGIPRGRDRLKLYAAALLEFFGIRQIILLYRIRGMIRFLLGSRSWGKLERRGFQSAEAKADAQ